MRSRISHLWPFGTKTRPPQDSGDSPTREDVSFEQEVQEVWEDSIRFLRNIQRTQETQDAAVRTRFEILEGVGPNEIPPMPQHRRALIEKSVRESRAREREDRGLERLLEAELEPEPEATVRRRPERPARWTGLQFATMGGSAALVAAAVVAVIMVNNGTLRVGPEPVRPPARSDDGHTAGMRSSFAGVNLAGLQAEGSDFSFTDLRRAVLTGANLKGVNFQGSMLCGIELEEADLTDANFRDADIRDAKMATARNLTREQVLSVFDWRGADLPPELQDLELPSTATHADMDRLGRNWKAPRQPGRK